MAMEAVTEQFTFDINISRARYAELLVAEHDADCLKSMIHAKANNFDSITANEVKLIDSLYYDNEEEESEE